MDLLGAFAVATGAVAVVLAALFVRRLILGRGGGTVEVSLRLSRRTDGRGWALGVASFSGDQFRWHRMFSFALRPRRVLLRRDLEIVGRRRPTGAEALALMRGSVVLECETRSGPVELAMTDDALTGFLSWLESSAPGSAFPPLAAR